MKKIFIAFVSICAVITGKAQSVGIGNTSPDSSAMLDLTNAQGKGLLIPSMTTAQKMGIDDPANGLMIYQTDSAKGFYFFDNAHWRRVGEGGNAWTETDSAVYTLKHVSVGDSTPHNAFESRGNF